MDGHGDGYGAHGNGHGNGHEEPAAIPSGGDHASDATDRSEDQGSGGQPSS
jgi:hypothetical protein